MLNRYKDPILLHKNAKTQLSAKSISHAITVYVPETSMPPKCHLCVTYASYSCTDTI